MDEPRLAADLGELAFDFADVPLKDLRLSVLLHRVSAILREHSIVMPADLTFLFKALISLEGLSRQYDPEFQLIERAKPYVKAQKNDGRDAEAIAEAATRPTMRFVALKSEVQLDMQTLHSVRDRLVAERTSLMNQIRALLIERGIAVPQGRAKLMERLAGLIAEQRDERQAVRRSHWDNRCRGQ